MDILEPSIEVKQDLLKIIKSLQWGKNVVDVKGSASLASQKYFGDYDLFSFIKYNNVNPLQEIEKIFKKVKNNSNIYFIELKIQYENGDKKKYNETTITNLNKDDFKEPIEYIKLDFVIKVENSFYQLSINYIINKKEKQQELSELKQNKQELINSGDYFKALKRQFSIYKVQGKKDKLVELTRFFNSETGRKNQVLGNLNAMLQLLEHGAKTSLLLKKIIVALKDLGFQPPQSAPEIYEFIKNEADRIQKEINEEAKIFI